jgi:hypothetical protein
MSKTGRFIKRTVRVALWVALGFVMLFILVALLIQIPSVQNKIVDYATSFISSKTNTRVEIESVGISFPKAIVLEEFTWKILKRHFDLCRNGEN